MLTDTEARTLGRAALLEESELTRDLSKSISARALASAGDLIGAIDRKCLADTIGLWRRLCILAEWPQLERITLDACFPMADPWGLARDFVIAAMRNADALDAARHWYAAEIAIRRLASAHAYACGRDLVVAWAVDGRPDAVAHDTWSDEDFGRLGREACHYGAIALGPDGGARG